MTTDVINTMVALDERNVNQSGQQNRILLLSFLPRWKTGLNSSRSILWNS